MSSSSTTAEGSSIRETAHHFCARIRVWDVLLGLLVIAAVAAFAGFQRPLWIDEVLHFATGAMSFSDVMRTVDYTTIEINHGQTGVYILLDWLFLQIFGASAVALRFPSLIASGILLWSCILFIRDRQLGRFWEAFVVVTLISHYMLMVFTADARPYMPLAASVLAMLAYFAVPLDRRKTPAYRVLGFTGVSVGSLMQAYWIFFLVLALTFGLFVEYLQGRRWLNRRQFVASLSPRLVGSGVVLYVVVGQLTWMRRTAQFNYEPFEMIGGPSRAVQVFWSHHVTTQVPVPLWLALVVLTVIALLLMRRMWRAWLAPLILLGLALLSSIGLSVLSISRGYWLFDRQWVAGMALSAVALTWLFGELWKLSAGKLVVVRVAVVGFVFLTAWGAVQSVANVVSATQVWAEQKEQFATDPAERPELFGDFNDQQVVYAANVNVARGGSVWTEFNEWYRGQAGMRPEFRDTNPSWTVYLFGPDRWTTSLK
ncbi:glycosyltransferase family 39 protein [Candidatus Nanopelagicales bacterium]|nr:glycosyltransferase family 39 protein [Candidatus Nanopelagicales bacterium]